MTAPARGPVVVIGAGPAGVAAAEAAVEAGAPCALLDEGPPTAAWAGLPASLRRRVDARWRAAALAVWADRRVLLRQGRRTLLLGARGVVVATGANDLSVPWPGWTLQGVLPSREALRAPAALEGRGLVIGVAPFALETALRLRRRGARLAAVAFVGPRPSAEQRLFLWGDEADAAAELARAGVTLLESTAMIEAIGERGQVVAAAVAPARESDWMPRSTERRLVRADYVVCAYGPVPEAALCRAAGCRAADEPASGWAPRVDERLETSVPGLFCAGAAAGSRGLGLARAHGREAGAAAAGRALTRLRRLWPGRAACDAAYAPRPGLWAAATPATVVCPCEGVSLQALRAEAAREPGRDIAALKLATRVGMGECQGRRCGPAARALCGAWAAGTFGARPPARPVELGALARMEEA